MRAILVSVDFADLLAITLPYNRHHFTDVLVVTTHEDKETQWVALENRAQLFLTNAFYQNGADFNKWLALELGLDAFGRDGWLCIMDADVLWPRETSRTVSQGQRYHEIGRLPLDLKIGNLYTPRRRMLDESGWRQNLSEAGAPPERLWPDLPLHPQQVEFAGYTQIFHANDPHLPSPPWHQTDWRHCGGADSFFQALWPPQRKVRPPFEVLHLGPAGLNSCGRVTPRLDGTEFHEAEERRCKVRDYIRGRAGKYDHHRFDHKRL
jgi:hypothetical protein